MHGITQPVELGSQSADLCLQFGNGGGVLGADRLEVVACGLGALDGTGEPACDSRARLGNGGGHGG